MIHRLQNIAGKYYTIARYYVRKYEPRTLTDFYSSSQNVLVIMPDNTKLSEYSWQVIKLLYSKFPKDMLTIVVDDHSRPIFNNFKKGNVIWIGEKDFDIFYLPRKNIINKINTRYYDLVIDLNLSFNPAAAMICKKTKANHTLGFSKKYGDLIYNIQYRIRNGTEPDQVYGSLCTFLEQF